MPLKWDLPKQVKKPTKKRSDEPTNIVLGDGWELVEARGVAVGQAAAKSFARSIRADRCEPWAVLGEQPLEDEQSACGCTNIVFDGVRMQLPEKVFGLSWLELRHAELDLAFCFDCTMALRRWAQLSLDMINDRRAGRPAWSGWTCDASELQQAWEQSIWAEEGGRYHRREEWNWVYRTDYQGTVHVGAAADHSRKRAIAAQQHKLIRLKRSDGQGGGDVGERELAWVECDAASAAECEGEPEQWDEQEALCERSMKLYEDHLAEMGLSRCCLRFREFEHGWEIRLRWWSCLNPGCEPKRGLPHARLRETTIRLRYGAACAARRTEERSLYFPGGESQRGGDYEGGASLDADEMRGAMELDGPPTTALLELAAPSRATAAPPAVSAKSGSPSTERVIVPSFTRWNRISQSWTAVTASPPCHFATSTPATPPVPAAMPVSRATKPGIRQSPHSASDSR